MLRHTEGLQQIYDKMRFTKNRTRKLRQSYEKTYDSSLAVIRKHQSRMQ